MYSPDEDSYTNGSTGDIVGGVVGVMAFLICCVLPCVLIFLLARRRRPQNDSTPMTHVVNLPAPATQPPPMSPPVMQPPATYSPYDQRNSFQHFSPPPQNPYYSNMNQQGTYYTNMNQNPAYTPQSSHYAQQSSPHYPPDTQNQSSNPQQSPPAPQKEPNDLEQFLDEAGLSKYFPIFQRFVAKKISSKGKKLILKRCGIFQNHNWRKWESLWELVSKL